MLLSVTDSMTFQLWPQIGRFRIRTSTVVCWRLSARAFHHDTRNKLSELWVPTGGIAQKATKEDANDLLVRAGYLRQAYSGIFHLLPLGLRVQEKIERLIDKYMRRLGASKLSLSSISSQGLWMRSGRLNDNSEIFRFDDRKGSHFILAPTHEEEITTLVGGLVKSYRDLPLRVYQVSRKYRDEPRPRQGLLRGKEFLMKDLYTFDYSVDKALATYDSVKRAYVQLFDELKIPYIVAAADSGNIGGSLSHEFHFPTLKGEDTVITCDKCDNIINEEVTNGRASEFATKKSSLSYDTSGGPFAQPSAPAISTGEWLSISKDKRTLIRVYYPKYLLGKDAHEPAEREVNSHAVRTVTRLHGIEIDLSVKNPLEAWKSRFKSDFKTEAQDLGVLDVYDHRVRPFDRPPLNGTFSSDNEKPDIRFASLQKYPGTNDPLDLIRVQSGDECPCCEHGILSTQTSIELGHTFLLGTRYSSVLQANVIVDRSKLEGTESFASEASSVSVPLQMGCHGIGVSRMISAVADMLADDKGLNWPRVIAPFSVVICYGKDLESDADQIYDALVADGSRQIDVVLDDRSNSFAWKLKDADLIGFPIVLVLGKSWKSSREVEVQCRTLNKYRRNVNIDELPSLVFSLLDRL